MVAALLLWAATYSVAPPPHVERCEINVTDDRIQQVILWRWDAPTRSYRVAQWWIFREEPSVRRLPDHRWLIRSKGVEFTAGVLLRTDTPFDPETRDRCRLDERHRQPYFEVPR